MPLWTTQQAGLKHIPEVKPASASLITLDLEADRGEVVYVSKSPEEFVAGGLVQSRGGGGSAWGAGSGVGSSTRVSNVSSIAEHGFEENGMSAPRPRVRDDEGRILTNEEGKDVAVRPITKSAVLGSILGKKGGGFSPVGSMEIRSMHLKRRAERTENGKDAAFTGRELVDGELTGIGSYGTAHSPPPTPTSPGSPSPAGSPTTAPTVLSTGSALNDAMLHHAEGMPRLGAPLAARTISVVPLPTMIGPEHQLKESLVVLIDVLRMTSTIVTAMGENLNSCRLFSSIAEIKHADRKYLGREAILGGEQKRVLIPGFDRDNSPLSYMRMGRDSRKISLFLTTNGTRALPWVKRAKFLVLGSFLNLSALVRTIIYFSGRVKSILLVCSGTERGTVRAEDDELCAAYLLKMLITQVAEPSTLILDEAATAALQKIYGDTFFHIAEKIRKSPGAKELAKIGQRHDIEFCLQRDRYNTTLPVYSQELDL